MFGEVAAQFKNTKRIRTGCNNVGSEGQGSLRRDAFSHSDVAARRLEEGEVCVSVCVCMYVHVCLCKKKRERPP